MAGLYDRLNNLRIIMLGLSLCALAACGDPLDQIDRLSDVALADEQIAALVPEPGDQADDAPVLPVLVADAAAAAGDGSDGAEAADLIDDAPVVATAAPARTGFLGLFAPPAGASATNSAAITASVGPDAREIAPGQLLPYGEIATVCGKPESALGQPIAAASGLAIYDSAPGSIALRSHFITGFPDGCARQFSAALAMFGDVGTHEVVRYQPSNAGIAFSETDLAYEEIKGRVCGVPSGQPCGARLEDLGRNTAFVTVYERFGSGPVWADILIHDGAVVAMDFKRN
jgi:hypothetical protein